MIVAVLTVVGAHGVLLLPKRVALMHNKTPAEAGLVSATAGAGG